VADFKSESVAGFKSEWVAELRRNPHVKATFNDRGNLALKNIERPIQAFEVKWDPADWKFSAAAPDAPTIGPAPPIADIPLTLPDKPSIAVLPFQNMSGDPDQEYFADGMAEEIITAPSRFRSLVVIARNSSFTYTRPSHTKAARSTSNA
jgi:hypothetical protein